MKHHPIIFKKTERTAAEMKIFVYVITANALMRDGKLEQAYDLINEVLLLLAQIDEPGCMLPYAVYQVMENICEKTNRSAEAMKYHQILRDYEKALFEALPIDELEKMVSITKHVINKPIKNAVDTISELIARSKINEDNKIKYLERLSKLDLSLIEDAYKTSKEKITDMDIKYIICIAADLDVKDIGLLFNVEEYSVYTIRYRIKKKFAKEDAFQMIL